MTAPDPHEMLLAEIGKILRDQGDPAERYVLARSVAEMMGVKAAHAARDLVVQAGSLAAAAARLGVSPQAVSQLLAKHALASPNPPGRPKKEPVMITYYRVQLPTQGAERLAVESGARSAGLDVRHLGNGLVEFDTDALTWLRSLRGEAVGRIIGYKADEPDEMWVDGRSYPVLVHGVATIRKDADDAARR